MADKTAGIDDKRLVEDYRLYKLRQMGIVAHDVIGPMEHKAFVREAVRDDPWMAVAMGFAIPAYTALKAMGVFPDARSPASMDEVFAGYEGLYEGVTDE